MKNPFARKIRLIAAGAAFVALTLTLPAHSVETTCTGSGGANCPALIPDGPLPGVNSTVIVPANICGGGTVTGATVRVNLSHSWIGDLSITVKNPASTTATLLNPLPDPPAVSCSGDDIAAVFQDGGAAPTCQSANVPSLSGTLAPVSPLAPLAASVVGTWTLTVTDNMHGNNGLINDWAVDVTCGAALPPDMGVTLSGFPAAVVQNAPITGTVTCANVGSVAATSATCAVAGATASNCVQQPGSTPVASFPVANVAPGGSIACSVAGTMPSSGNLVLTGTTGAGNDSNAANNSTVATIASSVVPPPAPSIPAPALSWPMMVFLLGLLLATGAWLSRSRKSS